MKSLFYLLLFVCFNAVNAQLWMVDPLEPIFPDSNYLVKYSNEWTADFSMGTSADVHVILKLDPDHEFKVRASINGKAIDYSVWSQLIDVPVEQNTGLDSRTEQFINQINPYVIRRAPFRIYEVIKPLDTETFITENKFHALRLSIPPSLLIQNGKYEVNIDISGNNNALNGTFNIIIHPVKLPELSESKFFYTNWFNLTRMEEKHKVDRWSDPWFIMLKKYAELMAYGRQNSITIPNELFHFEGNEVKLDESKLIRFIDVFRNYGFRYFESPHIMFRGDEDDWSDPELKVVLTKRRYYTENGKEDVGKLIQRIKQFTLKHDLTNSWLQHIADEPTPVNANCYKDVADQVKSIFPEIKIMEATNARDSIAGAIDIWCPLINDFQENESFFREREKLGESVLVYTCLIPGGEWLNRTLDMERLRQVYFGWGASFYNTSGYLHWGLNQYHADPYEQSVVKHPSPIAGPNNYLPAGDTHVIYPGEKGPLSSIRFEAHRIGCEDYELLQMLKTKNKSLTERIIKEIFRSYTDYNLDLSDYRGARERILNSLN